MRIPCFLWQRVPRPVDFRFVLGHAWRLKRPWGLEQAPRSRPRTAVPTCMQAITLWPAPSDPMERVPCDGDNQPLTTLYQREAELVCRAPAACRTPGGPTAMSMSMARTCSSD